MALCEVGVDDISWTAPGIAPTSTILLSNRFKAHQNIRCAEGEALRKECRFKVLRGVVKSECDNYRRNAIQAQRRGWTRSSEVDVAPILTFRST
jgi:hypothetical protein